MAKLPTLAARSEELPTFKEACQSEEDRIADQVSEKASASIGDLPTGGYTQSMANAEKSKRAKDFEIVDANALYAIYPQFFKLVPDLAKVRAAIKLGIATPGVVIHGSVESIQGEEDAA